MRFITDKHSFILPGLVMVASILWFQKKRGLFYLLAVTVAVLINDAICHQILKPLIGRPRPCHLLDLLSYVPNCSHSFSFPSNHASNIFTFATVTFLCFRNSVLFVYLLAVLVAFSRVYLGVHNPTDVVAGAVCGIVIGTLGYQLFRVAWDSYRLRLPNPHVQSH